MHIMTVYNGTGTGNTAYNGTGSSNTLSYSGDSSGVTINTATDTVVKNLELAAIPPFIPAVYWEDTFSDIQTFVGSASGNTTFQSVGTGSYTFTGGGTSGNTLDYSQDTNGVTINLSTDTVTKDLLFVSLAGSPTNIIIPIVSHYSDSFSDIQTFVGSASGNTTFQSVGTGSYTFTGEGTAGNTLDYSQDANDVTINLATHTVSKDLFFLSLAGSPTNIIIPIVLPHYSDSFSDIQNFVGNAGATDTIDFSGTSNQYSIVDSTDGSVTVTDTVAGRDGTVKLDNIQNLQFTDTTINPVAPATVNDTITELYIGYYNRAQDPSGESYWAGILSSGTLSINQIAESFSVQTESTNLYSFLANPTAGSTPAVQAFVSAVYGNLFDRMPDPVGEGYWVTNIQNGTVTVGDAILDIIAGAPAGSSDAATIANKVTVADYYETQIVSHNVPFSQSVAEAVLTGVTSSVTTVGTAETAINAFL
jgi:hypothetical protein